MPELDIDRMGGGIYFHGTPHDSQPSKDSPDPFESSSEESSCSPNPSQDSLGSATDNVTIMEESLDYIRRYAAEDPEANDEEVKKFFYATFEVCQSNTKLTEEKKHRIGSGIKNAIPYMDYCLRDMGDDFDGDYGPEALVVRSGYQFMIEKFADFPDGKGSTLKNAFKYFEDEQSIEPLDKALRIWKKRPYICMEDIHHTAEELNRPAGVPESHDWWFQSFRKTR